MSPEQTNEFDLVLAALKLAAQKPDEMVPVKARTLARLIGGYELNATALALLYDAANGNPMNPLAAAMKEVAPAAHAARTYLKHRGLVDTRD